MWKGAEEAVKRLYWRGLFFVDADHINLGNVDRFIPYSNFFTIDVADSIGLIGDVSGQQLRGFKDRNSWLIGNPIEIEGIDHPLEIDEPTFFSIAINYL